MKLPKLVRWHPETGAPLPPSTNQLIEHLAEGDPEEALSLGELLDEFRERSFGLFLLLVLLPTFIPIPMGQGAFSGGLIALIGLQLLFRLEHPWLPGFIARYRIHRHSIATDDFLFPEAFEQPAETELVLVPMRAGDVLIFHGSSLHTSQPNRTTDRWRRSFICHYISAAVQSVHEHFTPALRSTGEEVHTHLLELHAVGKIRPIVGSTFRFDEIPGAFRAMEERRTSGRVVIVP